MSKLIIRYEKFNMISQSQTLQMFLYKYSHQSIIFLIIMLLGLFQLQCNLKISVRVSTKLKQAISSNHQSKLSVKPQPSAKPNQSDLLGTPHTAKGKVSPGSHWGYLS